MTAPEASNPTSALAATVGRYFTVVSLVPSLLLVAFITVLARSGAWSHEPDFGVGIGALTRLGVGGTFVLILSALALGAVLHPLQFALVQFLEGYWGVSSFWGALRENRIRHHAARSQDLDLRIASETIKLGQVEDNDGKVSPSNLTDLELAYHSAEKVAAERLRSIYPANSYHIMPTRLGNVLRAAETRAGAAVGLDIINFAPHLMMVARREHAAYVNDQRTALDLAIRTCLVCLLGFAAALLYLWPHKLWLLISLVPFGSAWLCYQGAVAAAQEYGAALRMLLDLNRFAMYEQMRLPLPLSTAGERKTVWALKALNSDPNNEYSVRYRHPSPPPAT
ncbi:MAG: hypothetical protein JO272_15470 [Pseudonocardiales bacterium]|nr:hypothetical protein [Pseudonocardiales bacterium]